ncbi:MAG: insulinase family protein [Muribaculaceae bacterium]|nr:insulinase family protein [Muribaculaceae bacterium]MDE7393825.1 insulinase family protein [Muribaculaceae bacterium]
MVETESFELDNGLRLIVSPDTSTAMAAVNVLYNVGGRDEDPELTGLAHLFEHLMFAGSANIASFDGELQRAGGISNAWTSNDFTNFYDVLPAQNLSTALWLESDRMLSLSFKPEALEVQRNVVIEEFKQQCLNRPYGDLSHHLNSLVYKEHPYRYPVIGKEPGHIERVKLDDIRKFFYAHYAPNNAVVAVTGNVEPAQVAEEFARWFGNIPRREVAPRTYKPEPLQTEARIKRVSGNVPYTSVALAYPMSGYGTEQYRALDLLTDILANGRSSRFYRDLLMATDLYVDADSSILGTEEEGMFLVNMRLMRNDDATVEEAIRRVDEQLQMMIEQGPTEYEVERAFNRMASNVKFSYLNYLSKAQALAMALMHNEDINAILPQYKELTPEVLRRAAREVIVDTRRNTLIYSPAD